MTTIALQKNVNTVAGRKESIIDKIGKLYRENYAYIICGYLSLNGLSNACQVYGMFND